MWTFTQLAGSLLNRTLPASARGLSGIGKNSRPATQSLQPILNRLAARAMAPEG